MKVLAVFWLWKVDPALDLKVCATGQAKHSWTQVWCVTLTAEQLNNMHTPFINLEIGLRKLYKLLDDIKTCCGQRLIAEQILISESKDRNIRIKKAFLQLLLRQRLQLQKVKFGCWISRHLRHLDVAQWSAFVCELAILLSYGLSAYWLVQWEMTEQPQELKPLVQNSAYWNHVGVWLLYKFQGSMWKHDAS